MKTQTLYKYGQKILSALLIVCMIFMILPNMTVHAADDDQVKASITVTPSSIYEDDIVDVDIKLEGIPYEGKVIPNDVVLVIDRSGSMSGDLNNMIAAAKDFVDEVDLATHRIGIVDYSHTISSLSISKNRDEMKKYLDGLDRSGGSTRIDLGVDEAVKLLNSKRNNADGSIVLMTDGAADSLELALESAQRAKARGYSFYTVALTSSATSAANENLKKMATSEADHYFVWPSSGLPDVYRQISKKIGFANAKDVVIAQVISNQFELVPGSTDANVPRPQIEGQKLRWDMTQLGKGEVHLTYQIKAKEDTNPGTYNHVSSGSIVYTSYTGGTKSIVLDKAAITVKKHAPVLSNINQSGFDIAGGAQAVITGQYISNNAVVKLGSTVISSAVIANNQISFTMPAHEVGTDLVTVINPDNQVSNQLPVNFTSSTPLPTMTVTPSHGMEKKSQKVTVTGITLKATSISQLKVTVGGKAVNIVSYNTKTKNTLAFYVPNSFSAGDVEIVITDKGGTKYTGQYTYDGKTNPVMEITSITPASGEESKSHKVTITGKNFYASTSYMTVTVGGIPVNLITCTSTSLVFYVPNSFSAGIQPIVVTNKKTNQTATTQYEYVAKINNNPMSITSMSPTSGEEKKSHKVTITGKNFAASSSKMKVTVGGTEVTLITCTDTTLVFYVPNTFSAGVYDVMVTRADTNETLTKQYEYLAPINNTPMSITSMSPTSGEEKKSHKATITGKNFAASSSKMKVTVGGTEVTLITCTDTTLVFYVPNTFSAGVYNVVITRLDTGEVITKQYEYVGSTVNTAVDVTSVSPATGMEGTSQKITIVGTNFASGGQFKVMLGSVELSPISVTPTMISAYVPSNLAAATYPITVVNNDGTRDVLTSGYTYTSKPANPTPTVTSITPTTGTANKSVKIEIVGTNLRGGTKASSVTFAGQSMNLVTNTDTNIILYTPQLIAGTYDIVISNSYSNLTTVSFTIQ